MIPRFGASYIVFGPEKYAQQRTASMDSDNSGNSIADGSQLGASGLPANRSGKVATSTPACDAVFGRLHEWMKPALEQMGMRQKQDGFVSVVQLSPIQTHNDTRFREDINKR